MATTLIDLTKINCVSAGAGAFYLGTAVTAYRGQEALTDGQTFAYSVQQGADWEYGHGVYAAFNGTLTRSVIKSSNSNAPVNFTAGAQIAFPLLVEDLGGGSGGATINDSIISTGFVWSSYKTDLQITTSYNALAASIAALSDATAISLAGKEPTIAAGTAGQYWRGDKTWQTLDKAAVGLSNVDNTSDANKPISIATAAALAGKEPAFGAGNTTQYLRGDKTWQTLDKSAVGLGNVDNTSDANKPVSTAQQTALNLKQDFAALRNSTADLSLHTLAVTRGSAGATAIFDNTGFLANVTEYAQTSGTVRSYIGSFSTETNISHNMKYYDGNHRYGNDSTKFAIWQAQNNGGVFWQVAPPGVTVDIWTNSGQGYIAAFDNLSDGGANIWTAKFTGQLRWATGATLASPKNYLDAGFVRFTESTGVQAFDINRTLSGVTLQTNGYAGSDTIMTIKCYSAAGQIRLIPVTGEVNFGYGITVGAPTGGYKGVGSLNAQALYLNNVVVTSYVLDAARAILAGHDPAKVVDPAKYDALTMEGHHAPVRKFLARMGTPHDPMNIETLWAHAFERDHLTAMPNEEKVNLSIGIEMGAMAQSTWETLEVYAFHLYTLNNQNKALRSECEALAGRLSALEKKAA